MGSISVGEKQQKIFVYITFFDNLSHCYEFMCLPHYMVSNLSSELSFLYPQCQAHMGAVVFKLNSKTKG